jgi:PST family polysaccharide transporter
MKIFHFVQNVYKNQTTKNFSALALVQVTNYLFPLITLPYVLNIVGTEKFGAVALAQAFFTYQIIMTDFSFNLTSSASISQSRNDLNLTSKIFSETITIKAIILILMMIVLQLLILTMPRFHEEKALFNLGFFLVIGQVILPTWFFQGVEKMQYLTYVNFIAKTVCLILIFVLIKTKNDYIYIIALNGIGNLLSGIICMVLLFTKFQIKYKFPVIADLKKQFEEGLNLLNSNILVNVYTNSNIIILSYFVNDNILGMYGVAEKIVQTIRSMLVVFYQATYPQVSRLKSEGIKKLNSYVRKTSGPFLALILFITLMTILFAGPILHLLSGKANPEMIFYLRLFSIVPFIVAFNIPANQTLLVYNERKRYFTIIFIGTVLNVGLNVLLSSYFFATGTITSIIITETFITLAFHYSVYRKRMYF